MAKVDIKFNNAIMDRENIDKLAKAVNENADVLYGILDENGKIDSSKLDKKLYYHPIFVYATNASSQNLWFTCVIFNDSPTAFTPTTFVNAIKDLMDNEALIQINGAAERSASFDNVWLITKQSTNYVIYSTNTTNGIENISFDDYTIQSFADGVNEIF